MAIETVRGREFIIHFNGGRCIHSRNCVLDRPDVFVPNVKGEWIYPDKASSEKPWPSLPIIARPALLATSGWTAAWAKRHPW